MRAEKKQQKQAVVKDVATVELYEASTEDNKRRISDALDEFCALTKELTVLTKPRSKRKLESNAERMHEISSKCDGLPPRILWYLNIVDTNNKNVALLLEEKSLKKAFKYRIKAGKYRADVLSEYSKINSAYENCVKKIPQRKEPMNKNEGGKQDA